MRSASIYITAILALALMGVGVKPFPFPNSTAVASEVAKQEVAKLNTAATKFDRKPLLPSDVMVIVNDTGGHGSGVFIGGQYYLTASHVATGKTPRLDLKFHDGSIRKAELMWTSPEFDIALMRASGDGVDPANLSCRDVPSGESIVTKGNPFFVEFVESFGKTASSALRGDKRPKELHGFKASQILDTTVLPGQSGGPVFDSKGDLIGITVAVINAPGFGLTPTGYGVMIPSSEICQLLARP
jgi:S1-C subfamily serine protease